MEIEKGSLIIGHWGETPVKLNWTILLTAFLFGRFEFIPFFWIAFILLIFIHEAGHVFIIRSYNLWTGEIVVHGLGGYCRWAGEVSQIQRSLIAWGGILAQLIVLVIAFLATLMFGPAKTSFEDQVYHAFIRSNIFIILFNLIPIRPLDGAEAWKILGPLRDFISGKWIDLKYQRQDKTVQRQLKKIMNGKVDEEKQE